MNTLADTDITPTSTAVDNTTVENGMGDMQPLNATGWEETRSNIHRVLTTFWVFLIMGANDAAYGVCLYPVHMLV